eukprot:m.139452 g.139452  ORF g.139452 m.139452 type:complete len:139 (+) comp13169_c0_seq24:1401-1817(+)
MFYVISATLQDNATGDGFQTKVEVLDDDEEGDDDESEEVHMKVDNVRVHFLQPGAMENELIRKPRHHNKFHAAVFSNSMVHLLTKDVAKVMRDKSMIACESAKYMLVLNKDQTKQFTEKVRQVLSHPFPLVIYLFAFQ